MSQSATNPIGAKIVAMAAYRIGEGEVPPGSNKGPLPEKALAYCGLQPGQPWCAAFACLCKHDALVSLNLPDNDLRTASTGGIHAWGVKNKKGVPVPKPGDLGLVKDGTTETGYEHTVVVEWVDGQIVHTLEGNFGNQVRRNTRTLASMDYVRPY